jgi:hypothetical protein
MLVQQVAVVSVRELPVDIWEVMSVSMGDFQIQPRIGIKTLECKARMMPTLQLLE